MPEIPDLPIKVKPFEHQVRAFEFACRLFGLNDGAPLSCGCAFLMEMGCGKTLSAIAVAGFL